MRAHKMYVNISHAWFLNYGLSGNAPVVSLANWTSPRSTAAVAIVFTRSYTCIVFDPFLAQETSVKHTSACTRKCTQTVITAATKSTRTAACYACCEGKPPSSSATAARGRGRGGQLLPAIRRRAKVQMVPVTSSTLDPCSCAHFVR